jgi:ribosomal protein S18 acetylase RimI-like enzyme
MNLFLVEIKSYKAEYSELGLIPVKYINKYFNYGYIWKLLKRLGIYYNTIFFLANDTETYIGGVVIRKKPNFHTLELTYWVYNIYIKEDYRGQGLGVVLLNKTFKLLLKKGVKQVSLKVSRHNTIALNLYLKQGFIIVNEDKYTIILTKYF